MNRKRWVILFLLPVLLTLLPAGGALTAGEQDVSLGYGSRGEKVAYLQTKLHRAGVYPENIISGYFGSLTLKAVNKLEKQNGLQIDGKVGPEEWRILEAVSSGLNTKASKMVLGFYAEDYPGDKLSFNSLSINSHLIDQVATFDFKLESNGDLSGKAPEAGLKLARSRGAGTLMLVHNISGGIDRWSAYNAISIPSNRNRLVNNIMTNIKRYNYSGVNIDIEGLPAAGREHYTALLNELRGKLSAEGKLLTVSIPAKTAEDPGNSWSGAYDYRAIGRVADLILLMTYDEHWAGGGAGPVASLTWVTRVLDYAVTQIPRGKILLGIGCFGYDWTSWGQGKAVTWKAMPGLINKYGNVMWDNKNSVPYMVYWQGGRRHEVWFENKYSLAIKLKLVNSYNLAGIGFWRLGFEDDTFWETIRKAF